jgi:molybdopterin molybdotransferase
MISISEAIRLIKQHAIHSNSGEVSLMDALGCVAAETIVAPTDTPPFDNSAMDGYAFSYKHWDKTSPLKIVGEIQAGTNSDYTLKVQEASRIFTGAPVPEGADTVVLQEKTERKENLLIITDSNIQADLNIRPKGSQTKKGQLALPQGQLITPATISYLAGMGIEKIKVYKKPTVGIILTGKELVKPGQPLEKGQIYESNGIGLQAALRNLHIETASILTVDDQEEELVNAIKKMMNYDILILTGGVSVGEYDLVPAALEQCGVKKVFHKLKQKPGKPIFFGTHPKGVVFGLPGNPAAVMSCFYNYIQLAIGLFMKRNFVKKIQLPLEKEYTKKPGLTYFLNGKTTQDGVEVLGSQLSYMLNSFAVADCLVELEEDREFFEKGTLVDVLKFI